jgi:4-hydroxy-tetrahydrodipicolinate synthase
VQSRTGVNVEPATLARLAEIENIVGVKEASGNITQIANVLHAVPQDFLVLSGDDVMTLPVIALGGAGVISVASNQIPREMSDLTRFARQGDFSRARELHSHYMPLLQVNFIESNPIPVKWGMSLMGLLEPVYRLPLVEPSPESKKKIGEIVATIH